MKTSKPSHKIRFNKKADIFMPLLVLVVLVTYITLAFVILDNKEKRLDEIPVGLQAASVLKIYTETDRADFYVQKSGELAQQETVEILGKNSGYPEKNTCTKIKKTLTEPEYILFDKSCGDFNPQNNFLEQFNVTINKYLKKYQSTYRLTKENENKKKLIEQIKSFISLKTDIKDNLYLQTTSTAFVRTLSLKENKLSPTNQILAFNTKKYPLEYSTYDSFIEHQIQFNLNKPDLSDYNKLFQALKECKSNKSTCEESIKLQFPTAIISVSDNLYKINTNTKVPIILAFNPDSELPVKISS